MTTFGGSLDPMRLSAVGAHVARGGGWGGVIPYVTDAVHDPWAGLTPRDVANLLADLPIRWWIAGGWALDVEGRRPHRDVDVAVIRPEHEVLREFLHDWDLRIASGGKLRPWTSGTVGPPANAVWARPADAAEWHIDFKIEPVEGDEWVYRRDPDIRVPVAKIGVMIDGVPYLAPEIARLYAEGSCTKRLTRLQSEDVGADKEAMDPAGFPWRQLGSVLVDEGLLTQAQLELALAEQRRTGRLLGQILVDFGYLSGTRLARALAAQHGVELRRTVASEADGGPHRTEDDKPARWRPLGKLLVENGLVSKADLDDAVAEQRRSSRRLGEILVESGCLSGSQLARALAMQHGVDFGGGDDYETVITPAAPAEPTYQVWDVVLEPSYQALSVLHASANFLDAVDFAFEFVDEHEPEALEIQRADGGKRETLWTYSARRAASLAEGRKDLTETFGFDPTTWDGSLHARDFTGELTDSRP